MKKNTSIVLEYDIEKIEALNLALEEKGLDLKTLLHDQVDTYYNKHVHPAIRKFIDQKQSKEEK